MKRDEATYGDVARKYDEWVEIQASKPPPPRVVSNQPYVHEPVEDSGMGRTVQAAIGIGIGAVILVLAILSFLNAADWSELGRDSAVAGWTLAGVFLTISGLGAILSTWNHNFRVLVNPQRLDH